MKKIATLLIYFIFISSCYTQIIYKSPQLFREVVSSNVNSTSSAYVDVNDDSIYDMAFHLACWDYDCFACILNNDPGNQYAYSPEAFWCMVKPLEYGDTIGNNLTWSTQWLWSYAMYYHMEGTVVCNNFNDWKYVGIILNLNGENHYSWFKIKTYNTSSYARLYLSEYAYNSEPNKGLIAGDTLTSLIFTNTENIKSQSDINVYPNPAKSEFYFDLGKYPNDFKTIEIYSISGDLVKSQIIDNSLTKKIDIKDLNKGLYIVKLVSVNEIYNFKLVKK